MSFKVVTVSHATVTVFGQAMCVTGNKQDVQYYVVVAILLLLSSPRDLHHHGAPEAAEGGRSWVGTES